MIYEYVCRSCNQSTDIIKSAKEIDQRETCPSCGEEMERIISFHGGVKCEWFDPAVNLSINSNAKNKREFLNAKRMYEEKNQTELVEVGNDRLPKRKPRKSSLNMNEVNREFKAIRGY